MLPSSGGAISPRTSSTAVLRGFSQSAQGRAATHWRCQALGVASDDVADLPAGETVFGEPRMVGDPRITTAQAGVILKMTRQRVWNLIGRGELPAYGPRKQRPKTEAVRRPAAGGTR